MSVRGLYCTTPMSGRRTVLLTGTDHELLVAKVKVKLKKLGKKWGIKDI